MTALKIIIFILIEALSIFLFILAKPKKTGLFKYILFIIFQICILTWFIPASYFNEGELVEVGMYQVGFFDFFQLLFGSYEFSYFIQILILLVSIGAFYGVLEKTGKYRTLVEKIAKSFKGREKIFIACIAILLATLTSVFDYGMFIFMFIPFIIGILLLMGYEKVTACLATFGAMIIGQFGSTISYNITGLINEQISGTLATAMWYKVALFVASVVILVIFLMKAKTDNSSKLDEEGLFIGEKVSNKYSVVPIIVIFSILFVLLVLGCTNWENTFNITIFNTFNDNIAKVTIGDLAIITKLLGAFNALGQWSYAEISVISIVAALIIGRFYRMKHSDVFTYMANGAKKILEPALFVVLCYAVVYFSGNTMFYPTIVSKLIGFTSKFNLLFSSISVILGSLLHVDMLYTSSYVVAQLAAQSVSTDVIALLVQTFNGLTMLVAPTSAMLVLGLSYLNISYKEWIKNTWKLILLLLLLTIIVLVLAMVL